MAGTGFKTSLDTRHCSLFIELRGRRILGNNCPRVLDKRNTLLYTYVRKVKTTEREQRWRT